MLDVPDFADSARREVDPGVVAKVHGLAGRSAGYRELRRACPLPCSPRQGQRLTARVGRRLTPTEREVFAFARRADRSGWPAIHATVAELALLADRSERSVQRALAGLGPHVADCGPTCKRHLNLLGRIPVYDSVAWCCTRTRRTYARRQRPNILLLTRQAPRPGRHRGVHAAATPAARRAQDLGGGPVRRRSASRSSGRQIVTPTSPPLRGGRAAPASHGSAPQILRAARGRTSDSPSGGGVGPPADQRSAGRTAGSQSTIPRELGGAGRLAGDAPATPPLERDAPASSEADRGESGGGRPSPDEFERWRRERLGLPLVDRPAPPRAELLAELDRKARELAGDDSRTPVDRETEGGGDS
jgi:hypothetical protein